ncbi:conserved hypothetical protein [Vibrio jasicida]|jgi:hypothetical protein|uniref:Uncharacterized protein n=1 Tax=Vibrio jasicida TaxID=766224 RepID=A0AAU9QPG2_9VIBR|nr:hypothetical protein [Vibrio alginolyticus]CAH1592820.1 conserved hypothetical protein [Vibrio jasicida]CAH1597461.1 conserved hypothetical protein [Vibrio jasicida]
MEVISSYSSKENKNTSISISYEAEDALGFVSIQTVLGNGESVRKETFIGNARELKALSLLVQAVLELLTPDKPNVNHEQASILGKIDPFYDDAVDDELPFIEVGEFLSGLVRIELKYDDPEIDNDFYTSNEINGVFIDLNVGEATHFIHYLHSAVPILRKNEDD